MRKRNSKNGSANHSNRNNGSSEDSSCELLEHLRMNYEDVIKLIIKIVEEKDSYTKGHSKHVTKYAVMIAKKLGLPKEKIDEVREASLLHDIGKIAIEKEILNKPGPLTKREFERIIHHPDIGSRILNQSRAFRSLVPAIRHHHERYAGGGYPNPKMKKRRIPLYARIISIADAWDAMRSDRAYRRALTRRQAMTEMRRCAGIQFDPELANIFLGII